MLTRTTITTLSEDLSAKPDMFFKEGLNRYLAETRSLFGPGAAVVGFALSKSIRFPFVRGADNVLLGYNLHDYVVFIPRAVWRRLGSDVKSKIPKERHRWNSSFTNWRPGRGEVLLSGGSEMIAWLRAFKVLRPETLRPKP